MKKDEVPQDVSALGKITDEICYATDETGKYTTQLSKGWDVKITALDKAWEEINNRINIAKQKVLNGEASPLLYFMEKGLMDVKLLAEYSGFWQWQVKRHLQARVFKSLSDKKLQKYARVFNVTIQDLHNMNFNDA